MARARMRVCSVAGCARIQREPQCAEHRREHEQRRGSSTARGYGQTHRNRREAWLPAVEAGTVQCWRCNRPILPEQQWDLGHDDHDRTRYRGPEHIACNRATASRRPVPTPGG